jgi:hypothetical protein
VRKEERGSVNVPESLQRQGQRPVVRCLEVGGGERRDGDGDTRCEPLKASGDDGSLVGIGLFLGDNL